MESKAVYVYFFRFSVVSLQFLPVSSCRWKADEPAVVMHTAGGRRKRLGVGGRAREAQRFWELWKKKNVEDGLGGFKKFLFSFFHLGGKWSNLTCAYFSNGLVQPPTSGILTPGSCSEPKNPQNHGVAGGH